MDLRCLVNNLKECYLRHEKSLHINILSADYPEDVNLFLFELLTFKMVICEKTIVSIPEIPIYIEIASLIDQDLFYRLPIIRFLPFKHLSWNIKDFRVSQETINSIQVVCHFLNIYDTGKIDTEEFFFKAPKDPLSEGVCQKLLMKYLLNEIDETTLSFRHIEIFTNILAEQLIRFSSDQYFTIDNLKLKLKENNIRSAVFKSLLDTSKNFITPSIKERSLQLDNSNNYILFFNSQTSNSFSILYYDKYKVPDNIKLLLRSQAAARPENWELDDYNSMTMAELLIKLETIANQMKN